ncbi:ESX secretion-associated protein EspG [Saccharopolyspora erythraea]|uniref:ESX secretion-associated protein EspG n=1 Tax=Saccharopolyspora erythraea TaxID=1836 RepID=UPI001BA6A0DE|nr:ESX secretion-associated protein EspG [Saccharopolyspora erythraea]QUH00338.1 ESX secretion-associated protein EspG [Saccharopolyspora erythraea]
MGLLGRWQLAPVHLDIVLKYLELGDLTLPLDVPSFGRTTEEFGRIARFERPRMEELGIVVRDEIQPQLAEALRLLAKPYLWVDSLWFPKAGDDHCWRTLAVVTEGNRIVLGVQPPSDNPRYGGPLTVEVHEKAPLSQVLLPTLPPAPPGNRGPVRVPQTSFRSSQPHEDEEVDVMAPVRPVRAGSGDRQVELYEAIGRAEHVRLGQIAANLRDQYGRVRRSTVLKWFDNVEPDGRYLDHSARAATGEQLFMLTPADARLIGGEIESLVAQVR